MHRHCQFFSSGLVAAYVIALAGCTAPSHRTQTAAEWQQQQLKSQSKEAEPINVTHIYTVVAVDSQGKPVPDVDIDIALVNDRNNRDERKTVICRTDSTGRCPAQSYVVSGTGLRPMLSSRATFKASKPGHYPTSATTSSSVGSSYGSTPAPEAKLVMVRPVDFLEDGLLRSEADRELRDRVIRFLDVIRIQSTLTDTEVVQKGIGTSEFKGKKYLRLKLNSTTTYNNLRVNKYEMGKRLFDESVRKVLGPLNDNIAAPRAYFGYDIVVYGHSKNLTEQYATADMVEFRFLMPEAAVRRYKDKDISGQALLDASVQLMNDERVELKLQ